MTNQRSPLDSLNAHRERRPLASLDELNRTLSMLEDQLSNNKQAVQEQSLTDDTLGFLRQEQEENDHLAPADPAVTNAENPHKEALAAIAEELQRLRARTELRQAAALTQKLQQPETGNNRISAAERFIANTGTSTAPAHNATQPHTDSIMRRDFEELKRTVETLAREESLRRMSHRWDALDERFDNFEQKQAEKLHNAQPLNLDPALDAISARLDEIRLSVEQLPDNQSHSLRQLDERLDEISRAILATGYQRQQAEPDQTVFDELDRRFADLTSHLDEQYRSSQHTSALNDDRFIQALEERLDSLTRQVSEQTTMLQSPPPAAAPQADQQLLSNLEKQLSFITEHLSKPESLMPELAEIKPRLDVIEQAIDMNRDTVLIAAREAAEEAIRQVVDKGSERDTGFARQLADDLKALEQLTRETDERNNRTFNQVHDTLLKIADRLGQIEKDNLQKPPHAHVNRNTIPREQSGSKQLSDQFSVPDWGSETISGTLQPRQNKQSGSAHMSGFAPVRSPAAAAIEAARASQKNAKDTAVSHGGDEPAAARAKSMPRKTLLGGFAQAVRRNKTAPLKAAQDDNTISLQDTDLLVSDTAKPAAAMPLRRADERTDQTLAAMPDLNEIIRRVRNEQRDHKMPKAGSYEGSSKSDLISAARRAAQAAASESERLCDQNQTDASSSSSASLNDERVQNENAPKRSLRKPLLLALGAIIIAVTGLQLGNSSLFSPEHTAVQPDNMAEAQSAPAVPAAASAPVLIPTKVSHAEPSASKQEVAAASADKAVTTQAAVNEPAAEIQPMPEPVNQTEPKSDVPALATQVVAQAPDVATTQSIETTAKLQLSAIPAVPAKAGTPALRQAAKDGDARALYEIGMRYMDGRGVTSDFTEAAKWYGLAAERDFAPAQYRLGNFYEKGLGMPRDTVKAANYYEQAATQGNANAMHNLAVLYAMGPDGKPDNDKAAKWFFKAAELGVKDSQYNLGILSAKGLGRAQNLEESYKWFALAANSGDNDAAQKRDQVAGSLKPEQLEHAQNLVKLWKPKELSEEANSVVIPDTWTDGETLITASVDMKKAVRNIQLILQKNGFDAGTPDGIMGQKTRQAISDFQKANGMAPTGEVDQKLVEALLAQNT